MIRDCSKTSDIVVDIEFEELAQLAKQSFIIDFATLHFVEMSLRLDLVRLLHYDQKMN